MEEWDSSALVEQETIRAIVEGYAAGRIKLPRPDKKTPRNNIRYAPSFMVKKGCETTSCSHPVTVDSFVEFLGWNRNKIEAVLNALMATEQGLMSDRGFERQVPKNPGIGEQGLPGPQGPQGARGESGPPGPALALCLPTTK